MTVAREIPSALLTGISSAKTLTKYLGRKQMDQNLKLEIIKLCNRPTKSRKIIDTLGLNNTKTYRLLRELTEEGFIMRTEETGDYKGNLYMHTGKEMKEEEKTYRPQTLGIKVLGVLL